MNSHVVELQSESQKSKYSASECESSQDIQTNEVNGSCVIGQGHKGEAAELVPSRREPHPRADSPGAVTSFDEGRKLLAEDERAAKARIP